MASPVKNLKFKFYLSGYYTKDLLYREQVSDGKGNFELLAPVYEFDYNGLLYFPYLVIEGTQDAYVQSDYSFSVKRKDLNEILKMGSI